MLNAAKPADFHFDEMVWRSDAGLIDRATTELTAMPNLKSKSG
jgi:hypothetical protein